MEASATPPTDFDSPWKDILDLLFAEFMAFFFADAYAAIDWSRGHEYLDKELQKITADAETGRRTVDKLVKVYLLDGAELWVLVHVEVQMQAETDFPERLFVYNYRIRDRFGVRCATFAVLTDDDAAWRPTRYEDSLLGTVLRMDFATAKLLDLEQDWAALEASVNPFAVVVMAHAKHRATRRDLQARLAWKLDLTKALYRRGYDRTQVIALYRFLDWVMTLPEELARAYVDAMDEFEKEQKMAYLSYAERLAQEKGFEQGIEQGIERGVRAGRVQSIVRQLQRLFGPLAADDLATIEALSIAQLDRLSEDLLDFTQPADLVQWLQQPPAA
jgi:predicted transposase YdaD